MKGDRKVKEVMAWDIDNKTVKIFPGKTPPGKKTDVGISISEGKSFSFVFLDNKTQKLLKKDLKQALKPNIKKGNKSVVYNANKGYRLFITFRNLDTSNTTLTLIGSRTQYVNLNREDIQLMINSFETLDELSKIDEDNNGSFENS